MRLLKGMMVCLAALFLLGYVNSCDSSKKQRTTDAENVSMDGQETSKHVELTTVF